MMSVVSLPEEKEYSPHKKGKNHRRLLSVDETDSDMKELINADISAVKEELASYGYDFDKKLNQLFTELEEKPLNFNSELDSEKTGRMGLFDEAFKIVGDSINESIRRVRKRSIWEQQPALVFSSCCVFFFCVTIIATVALKDSKRVKQGALIASEMYERKEEDIVYTMQQLSENRIEYLREATYQYLISGGKIEPTEEMTAFLKELTDYGLKREFGLIHAALRKETTCSTSGFFSHVVAEGETLVSIADRCGFNAIDFDKVENIPLLNVSDVLLFNFNKHNVLTKITIYKDDDFHILDFSAGKLVSQEIYSDIESLIVEVNLQKNSSLYYGLKASPDLQDKGDLWHKVVNRLANDYSGPIVAGSEDQPAKYHVNIKYRHNTITGRYSVTGASLSPINHDS